MHIYTSPCRFSVCWWCCLPCWSCWESLKTTRVHTGPIDSLGYRSLTRANGCLIILDLDKTTRLWGTPTTNHTNVTRSFTVSTKSAMLHNCHPKSNDSSNLWQHPKLFWFSLVVVKALEHFAGRDWEVLLSFCTFYIFGSCFFFFNESDLAVVLKALHCVCCHHSPDNMSFFLPLLVWSRLQGRGKREDREPPCSQSSVVITCAYTVGFFYFFDNRRRRVRPLNYENVVIGVGPWAESKE